MNQEKIGNFILENRKKKKLTQAELAEKLGVTDRTISNWENGKNMPDLSLFKPLCDILDITINELLSGEEVKKEDYKDRLEENFINTIDYIDKKNIKSNDYISIFYLLTGIVGMVLSQVMLKNNEIIEYLTVISMILIIYSIKRLFTRYIFVRRIVSILLVVLCIIVIILSK